MKSKNLREIVGMIDLCEDLRAKLIKNQISIDSLVKYKSTLFEPLMTFFLEDWTEGLNKAALENYLYLCMDYYTYTDGVLIADYDYDQIMQLYMDLGGERITTADSLQMTTWNIVKHEKPGVVGSVDKIYTFEELESYQRKYHWVREWVVAPKLDGISAAVKVDRGQILRATTRYNGYEGQDITEVVLRARNADSFMNGAFAGWAEFSGYVKVELCVSNESFEELIGEKEYANRRSATSGIVNTPKNLPYAKYISIIPLAYVSDRDDHFMYRPLYHEILTRVGGPLVLRDAINRVLDYCRDPEFPYRTDGVVICPLIDEYDHNDIMSDSIAYKVNTKVGITRIKDLYISVGRAGKAVPMASVYPVECNETRVSDVSIGSFDKLVSMALHENETVEVFSAGDVIPQIRLPEIRKYDEGAKVIQIDFRCPYCGSKLEREGREMFCRNDECERRLTGKISNFVTKIGMENISDATIESLWRAGLVRSIPELFNLQADEIANLPGFGVISANNMIQEIERIVNTPVSIDTFFGALGIPNIAAKTARKIFGGIALKDITKKRSKLYWDLVSIDGIGDATASDFCEFIEDNSELIENLLGILKVVEMQKWKGNVCFTGFRDGELEARFNKLGYEVSDGVNGKTKAVIAANKNSGSGKLKAARKKGLPVYTPFDVDELFEELEDEL